MLDFELLINGRSRFLYRLQSSGEKTISAQFLTTNSTMHSLTCLILFLFSLTPLTSALPNAVGLQERIAGAMPEAFAYSNVGPAFFGQLDRRQLTPETIAYGVGGPVYFGQLDQRQRDPGLGVRNSGGGSSSESSRGFLRSSGSSSSGIFPFSPGPRRRGPSSSTTGNGRSDEDAVGNSRAYSGISGWSKSGSGERMLSYVLKCNKHRFIGNTCTVRCQCGLDGRVSCPREVNGCEEECSCKKDSRHR